MNCTLRTAVLGAVVSLVPVATAQVGASSSEEVGPAVPVGPSARIVAPAQGNGSYLGLGQLRGAQLPLDPSTGEDGHLGVAHLAGWFFVSGRGTGGPTPPGAASIYQFDGAGNLIATFPQTGSGGSAWGHRDLASDEASLKLWGGEEGGYFAEYDFDPNAGPTGTLAFNTAKTIAGVGLIRALARDPATGTFYTADFGSPIREFDPVTGTVVRTLPNPGLGISGFAWDDFNGTLWSFSQDNSTGTVHDRVEFNEIDPANGLLLGPTFQGITSAAVGMFNLASGCDIYEDPAFPASLTIVGVHQASPDHLARYDLDVVTGTPAFPYCTAKSGLVCGTPDMTASGFSSVSSSSGFVIAAGPARPSKQGVLIYTDSGPAATPFNNGLLCISPPVKRATQIFSGGTPGQCDGVFATDLNAFTAGLIGGNPAPFLSVPGTVVWAQYWGRDTFATGNFLSQGISFTIGP